MSSYLDRFNEEAEQRIKYMQMVQASLQATACQCCRAVNGSVLNLCQTYKAVLCPTCVNGFDAYISSREEWGEYVELQAMYEFSCRNLSEYATRQSARDLDTYRRTVLRPLAVAWVDENTVVESSEGA